MAKIKKFEYKHSDGKIGLTQYHYMCPGCKDIHAIRLKSDGGCHDFNMDFDKPTISPSVLYASHPVCHAFIRSGMIQFLGDCEHSLKNQTVKLSEIE
jgi:hypothetical protein